MKKTSKINVQFLTGGSLFNWIRLLWQNKFRISPSAWITALFITIVNILIFPIGVIETILYNRKIKKLKLKEDPVFVLGHWRSGTTYLVNLLSQDPQYSFFRMSNVVFPTTFLTFNWFWNWLLNKTIPKTRPMDNIKLDMAYPQEEEFAISNTTPYAISHITSFPKNVDYYTKFTYMNDDVTDRERKGWIKQYSFMLKKVALQQNNRRLLLKNPANTGRIKEILKLYPNAKFINIYRNPYDVISSTQGMYKKMFPLMSLQGVMTDDEVDSYIYNLYKNVHSNFFKQKSLIPKENIIDIKYEDFVKEPFSHLKKIYTQLSINDFDKATPYFKNFIDMQKSYKPNKRVLKKDFIDAVRPYIKESLSKFNYEEK
jgi:hypothetical protein